MEKIIQQSKVAESKAIDKAGNSAQEQNAKLQGKPLTPYQKYKLSKNKNGKKYFEFYDDIKVYTHNIYDW